MFGNKSKNQAAINKRKIYETEVDYSDLDPYSQWRKPLNPNDDNPTAKRIYLKRSRVVLTTINYINAVLCLGIFCGILTLVFWTDFEKAVLYDGTNLSCIIDPQGNISPYVPPRVKQQ